jgi:hypothetical protein
MIDTGYVDPTRLQFLGNRIASVREVAGDVVDALEVLDERHGEIHRDHPLLNRPQVLPPRMSDILRSD